MRQDAEASGELPCDGQARAVIVDLPSIGPHVDRAELRIRRQEPADRGGGPVQPRSWQEPPERVRNRPAKSVDRRLIAQGRPRQVFVGERSEVVLRHQAATATPCVTRLKEHAPRKLSLEEELPPLGLRVLELPGGQEIGAESLLTAGTEGKTEIRAQPFRRSPRRLEACREGIVEIRLERQAAIERGHHRRRDAVPCGIDPEEADRHGEDAPPTPERRFLVDLEGEAEPWLDVVQVRLPVSTAAIRTDDVSLTVRNEPQPALHLKLTGWELRNRTRRIRRLRGRLDRTRARRVEPPDVPVVTLRGRLFDLVAKADIEGQPVVDAPVIVNEHPVVHHLVRHRLIAIYAPRGRDAQEEGGTVLAEERRRRVAFPRVGPSEGERAAGESAVVAVRLVQPDLIPGFDAVPVE